MFKPQMYKKIGLTFFLLFFTQCNSTFSSFIKEKKYSGFLFSVSYVDMLPLIVVEAKQHSFKNSEFKRIRLVIDTGSNVSMISEKTFADSANSPSRKMSIQSLSSTSEIEYSEKFLDFYQGEEMVFENKKMLSTKFPDFFRFDGIIGNDLLSEFDLILNFPQSIFLLRKHQSINLKEHGFYGVPLDFLRNYIVVDVYMNSSEKRRFLLDTGSGVSYLAVKDGEKENFQIGDKVFFFDALGKILPSETRIAKSVCFISKMNCFKNAEFLTGSNSFRLNAFKNGEMAGLIGMNWLLGQELIISYSEKKIYYRQNSN